MGELVAVDEPGFLLQPTYRIRDGRAEVWIYGRLASGAALRIEDARCRPHAFVPAAHRERALRERDVEVHDTPLRDLAGRPLVRIETTLPGALRAAVERLRAEGIEGHEADLRLAYRYLSERALRSSVHVRGRGERRSDGLVVVREPELEPSDWRPALRTLSLDLETLPDASRILSAALVGCGAEEVLLCSPRPVAGARVFADEAALLRALDERVRALDPDVLLGWNVVDFDLRVLDARCRAHGIEAPFGREAEPIAFRQDRGFGRQSRAEIPGRAVLDGVGLVRDALRLPDYRLDTVARAVLGRGKRIDAEARDAAAEILRMYHEEPEALVAYNLEDARLVPEILAREGLLELTIERSLLSGMQLDRVGASIASFDLVYLPALRARGRVAPSVDPAASPANVRGGAVLDSVPGFHRRVAVYDFKSLYPSLIRTFHLDPLAHALAADLPAEETIEAPGGARFAREGALLPDIIDVLMQRREAARARGDGHADRAIKIMMNAMFGVLGSPSCRFFDPAIANAITGFGQLLLDWTRRAFEEAGFPVLYGDTDSLFVALHEEGDETTARREADALREHIETTLGDWIRGRWSVEPRLTLELERIYDRLFLPRVRGGGSGSKKRYAGRIGDSLHIVGLESVRRDWPAIARTLQRGALERCFRDQDPEPFLRALVAELREGRRDLELVYTRRLRKGSLERYTASTPPHVQAARKLGRSAGPIVHYVMTRRGPEPVELRGPLPDDIDRAHYLEKVLRPVADAILSQRGSSFDAILGRPQQLSLL